MSFVGLGRSGPHRQSHLQLLLDELTLFEVEKVKIRGIWSQEVQSVLARACVLALDSFWVRANTLTVCS